MEPELVSDRCESNESAKEFAGEFDPRIGSGHGGLDHGEWLVAEEVLPETGAGHRHFGEAGKDRQDKIPTGKAAEDLDEQGNPDHAVKEKPEGGIEGRIVKRGTGVDLGVDIISLKPSEGEHDGGEEEIDDFHFCQSWLLRLTLETVGFFR